jgi:hypothetical protein
LIRGPTNWFILGDDQIRLEGLIFQGKSKVYPAL